MPLWRRNVTHTHSVSQGNLFHSSASNKIWKLWTHFCCDFSSQKVLPTLARKSNIFQCALHVRRRLRGRPIHEWKFTVARDQQERNTKTCIRATFPQVLMIDLTPGVLIPRGPGPRVKTLLKINAAHPSFVFFSRHRARARCGSQFPSSAQSPTMQTVSPDLVSAFTLKSTSNFLSISLSSVNGTEKKFKTCYMRFLHRFCSNSETNIKVMK